MCAQLADKKSAPVAGIFTYIFCLCVQSKVHTFYIKCYISSDKHVLVVYFTVILFILEE